MQMLTVHISRLGRKGASRRSESIAQWVSSVEYAKMRFYYTLRRQLFINYSVGSDGVLAVRYWGPMTRRRAMKIVMSIPANPTDGLHYNSRVF